jgi:GH24 family phage-related lysozyme (muramidase)
MDYSGSGLKITEQFEGCQNSGDYQGAAAQFDRWDLAGGNVVAGLLRRRESETNEFNSAPQAV